MPELARTFERIANEGTSSFYEGKVAQDMVDFVQSKGGLWTMDDLREHASSWEDPLSITVGEEGCRMVIHECGPNSQGKNTALSINTANGPDFFRT
jgi:gamma-glutamyltranspeptidase/glutathione hydrolase